MELLPKVLKPGMDMDGFVVFDPTVRGHFYWVGFREMQEAPESGYERFLEFADDSPDYVYFYFKADGKYGKGRVTRPYLSSYSEEPLVIAPVILLMNDSGGRGVATDR